jgi:3-oxoadipate enol-lactonase
MSEHDVTASLSDIRVPTTVIAASGDAAVPVPVMAELADKVPGARLEVIDGPHMAPLEDPDRFASVVARHLDRVAE